MKGVLITIVAGLLCASASAQTVYKWVDEDGVTQYSQTLPPERVDAAHERLQSDGRVAESVARALTAEEREELRIRLEREESIAERERIKAQQDRLFMAAYPTEDDVRALARSQAAVVEAERSSINNLIDQASERFIDWVDEAAELERQGEPISDYLMENIANSRSRLTELRGRETELTQRLDGMRQQLLRDLERHRQLKAAAVSG
ncbi:MAG: DUF4124 domain-containing protein [Pseudomonadota bacterium]